MKQSSLERIFSTYARVFIPEYVDELLEQIYFVLDRDFRFDVAIPDQLIAVEIHGGGYVQGRHNRESGMITDFEKHNRALEMGWRVVYCTTTMIQNDPEPIFNTLKTLLSHRLTFENAETSIWTALIRNLRNVKDEIEFNGISIVREKRNQFVVVFGAKEYRTQNHKYLIDAHKEALELIQLSKRSEYNRVLNSFDVQKEKIRGVMWNL